MKIYTKTGDGGITSLADGERVLKTDVRIEAVGALDELNAQLGLLVSVVQNAHDRLFVESVQRTLFAISAIVCGSKYCGGCRVEPSDVETLELEIDQISQFLSPLRSFVLPGGSVAASVCHVCRTVCRRAERRILVLPEAQKPDRQATVYVNRLSDYLFALARKLNIAAQMDEKTLHFACR